MNFKKVTLAGLLFFGLSLTACSDNESAMSIETSGITMMSDMNTIITEAALGDFIAIHGTGLNYENIDSILVNDIKVNMLETYSEKDILYMQIPIELPKEETNKIYIYNSKGIKELAFKTLVPDLKLTRMFNEYTKPGDTIMIYGDFFNLYEIDSLNAVVDFNGKISNVIASSNTHLIAQVPKDVDKNIKVKVKGLKHNVEAVCPGRYYDRENLVIDFDEIMPKDETWVVTDAKDEQRLSGNFLRIDDSSETKDYGWWTIAELSGCVNYPAAAIDTINCKNYELKFEFRSSNAFIKDKIKFYNYPYWAAKPPMIWEASDFVFQKTDCWETITLPFIIGYCYDYPDYFPSAYNSFQFIVALSDPTMSRNFAFDNFRVYKKGD